eukprot:m.230365 g.230365  ORF g.230365 m.230365 type:complete len:308 (+) comp15214_c0_seq46:3800-4723(+)
MCATPCFLNVVYHSRTTLDDEPASASASSAAASQPVQQSEAQEEEEVEYVTLEQIRNEYAQESECLYETLSVNALFAMLFLFELCYAGVDVDVEEESDRESVAVEQSVASTPPSSSSAESMDDAGHREYMWVSGASEGTTVAKQQEGQQEQGQQGQQREGKQQRQPQGQQQLQGQRLKCSDGDVSTGDDSTKTSTGSAGSATLLPVEDTAPITSPQRKLKYELGSGPRSIAVKGSRDHQAYPIKSTQVRNYLVCFKKRLRSNNHWSKCLYIAMHMLHRFTHITLLLLQAFSHNCSCELPLFLCGFFY